MFSDNLNNDDDDDNLRCSMLVSRPDRVSGQSVGLDFELEATVSGL